MRTIVGSGLALAVLSGLVTAQDNVLFLLADDIGVDRIGAYGEHPNPGNTPNIDALAANGVLFRNAWSHPSCTPTRVALMTGRHPVHTLMGAAIKNTEPDGLPLSEITLFEMLEAGTNGAWSNVALGKWHMAGVDDGPLHPNDQGVHYYAGNLMNMGGLTGGYYNWTKVTNGVTSQSTTYSTTDTVNDALAILPTLPEPWFGYLAFNAAHAPLHQPPAALHSFTLSGSPLATPVDHMKAMIEALDTEIGRLVSSLDPALLARTTIVFMTDNGTAANGITPPFDPNKGKPTIFEGGINVPMIVSGSLVAQPGREVDALVTDTDLVATMAEIAGFDLATVAPGVTLDSVSFLPYLTDPAAPDQRSWVFSQGFWPNGSGPYGRNKIAIRDDRYKILRYDGPTGFRVIEYYDLLADPFETNDLLKGPLTQQQISTYLNLAGIAVTMLKSGP